LRLFADLRQAVDRGTTAGQGGQRQHGACKNDAVETDDRHLHYSVFGAPGELTVATATGAACGVPSEEVVSLFCGGRGDTGLIETWPRPVTVPDNVRFDCRFVTLTTSPSA